MVERPIRMKSGHQKPKINTIRNFLPPHISIQLNSCPIPACSVNFGLIVGQNCENFQDLVRNFEQIFKACLAKLQRNGLFTAWIQPVWSKYVKKFSPTYSEGVVGGREKCQKAGRRVIFGLWWNCHGYFILPKGWFQKEYFKWCLRKWPKLEQLWDAKDNEEVFSLLTCGVVQFNASGGGGGWQVPAHCTVCFGYCVLLQIMFRIMDRLWIVKCGIEGLGRWVVLNCRMLM